MLQGFISIRFRRLSSNYVCVCHRISLTGTAGTGTRVLDKFSVGKIFANRGILLGVAFDPTTFPVGIAIDEISIVLAGRGGLVVASTSALVTGLGTGLPHGSLAAETFHSVGLVGEPLTR